MSENATTTVAKPAPSKAESYLTALAKVKAPKSDEGQKILSHVGQFVADDATVKAADKSVSTLTEQLDASRTQRDGLVTYRNRAIRTARKVGYSVRDIAKAYGVSNGTVQNVAAATTLREALKAGGNANPPSEEALMRHVSNASATERDALIATARTTGELPQETVTTAPKLPTAKALLARAESLSDAISALGETVPEADKESRDALVRVLTNALAKARAVKVDRPAKATTVPTPKDVQAAQKLPVERERRPHYECNHRTTICRDCDGSAPATRAWI